MLDGEGVLEVEDGNDETEEFSKSDYESNKERGDLGGQGKDTSYADISEVNGVKVFECLHQCSHREREREVPQYLLIAMRESVCV